MRYILVGFVALVLLVIGLFGFRGDTSRQPPLEVFPDMDRQPRLRPVEPNAFFPNGVSSQRHVAGTIARAQPLLDRDKNPVYPFQKDHPVNNGRMAGTTNFLETIPLPVTRELVARGHERYQINCVPCHGSLGDGQGMVTRMGVGMNAANLHDPIVVRLPDGQLYRTIALGSKEGTGVMKGYAANITVADRWAIVAYLRALQLSRLGGAEDVGDLKEDLPGEVRQLFPGVK